VGKIIFIAESKSGAFFLVLWKPEVSLIVQLCLLNIMPKAVWMVQFAESDRTEARTLLSDWPANKEDFKRE